MADKTKYVWWGERPEDDITKLDNVWEVRVAEDNRVYFVNHESKTTQWSHPTNGYHYRVSPGLPYGWQKYRDDDNSLVYVDHFGQIRSHVDPRLFSKVVDDFPKRFGIQDYRSIRNSFSSLVRADKVLKDVDLSDKVVMITGGNSGIGYRTALAMVKSGAHVIIASRNEIKANNAITKLNKAHKNAQVEFMKVDLGSLHSVKELAKAFISRELPLHILVCNAGVFGGPLSKTVDGLEQHFAVNHLGHFYLANLLTPVLKRSKPSRVVVVTSESHWYPSYNSSQLDLQFLQHPTTKKYSAITAYGASKLCNLLFTLEYHRRNVEDGISCNAVHPGNLLPTGLSCNAGYLYQAAFTAARLFTKSVDQAASTIVYCAAHPSMNDISGMYMSDCWPVEPSGEAQDSNTAVALWELSEQIIAQQNTD
ncbi:WW domain-containing oxidoreductase-like [Halichondria panicea]|uniref:WW domain-containing oxidoreductase-like n=1 Tax=Halichondria panicea TaxID=6063 RepID=UPI00312BBBF5